MPVVNSEKTMISLVFVLIMLCTSQPATLCMYLVCVTLGGIMFLSFMLTWWDYIVCMGGPFADRIYATVITMCVFTIM